MNGLTAGGATEDLPDGWVVPWGYPATGNRDALWIKEQPAQYEDHVALEDMGWTSAPSTHEGTFYRYWDHPQYADQSEEISHLDPWETVPRYGGEGSQTYKFQHIPEYEGHRVIAAYPRWWIYNLEGKLVRAEGGEAVYKEDYDDPNEYHKQIDMEMVYDEDDALYRVKS